MSFVAHPHDPPTVKARKLLGTRYAGLMDRRDTHVRVDMLEGSHRRRAWRPTILLLGMASDLHGPQGVCTCCPRRPRLTVDGDEVGV